MFGSDFGGILPWTGAQERGRASKLAGRVAADDLTARERQVLALIARGKGNPEIGTDLNLTERTVKVHVNNILTKLGVASRTEALALALRRDLVRLDDREDIRQCFRVAAMGYGK